MLEINGQNVFKEFETNSFVGLAGRLLHQVLSVIDSVSLPKDRSSKFYLLKI